MSLKHFHIFFIVLSIITATGFGLWCFLSEKGQAADGSTAMGAISLVAAVGLVIYAIKFLQKLKRENL